jgi:hypothetical protein
VLDCVGQCDALGLRLGQRLSVRFPHCGKTLQSSKQNNTRVIRS